MEYSSTKKERLPGISFASLMSDNGDSDDDDDYDNYNIRRSSGIINNSHDVTMNSSVNYYRCDPVESPMLANDSPINTTMESPITNMAGYTTAAAAAKSANNNTNKSIIAAATPPPSSYFSPTTNALNQSLIQHAESLVDNTVETPLERVENGVMSVMERFGSAFSSVKKRTLRAAAAADVNYTVQEDEEERECGEQTIVLDVAAAYMARLARDGLYDDDVSDDDDNYDEVGDSSNTNYEEEKVAVVPQSTAVIAVEADCDDSFHDDRDESKRTTYEDSFYHDNKNSNNNNSMEEEEDQDLVNDSYYIGNAVGFCSSKSVDDSSISETASEADDDDIFENDDDDTADDKSCSLDLTGIEKIMNLDDTLPSVIRKIHLCRSNSDVDLSGIDGVMNLDETLPLEDYNCTRGDDEEGANETGDQHVTTATDFWKNGDTVQAEPSLHDNYEDYDHIVPSSNVVDSSLRDDNMADDVFVPSSNGDIVQDEYEEDDDDFVPSAIKQMISQQESQFSSLLGSISNMKSTPCRIKKLARLMGEEDEDADLNGIVDMTTAGIGLTPVKRRLELVAEEELQIESAGKARAKQNALVAEALFNSGLEPELKENVLQEREVPSTTPSCVLPESVAKDEATQSKPSMELEVDGDQEVAVFASPQMATESPKIAADSPEAPIKSPWLSFISRQSPLSQSREATPTQLNVQIEEAETHTQPSNLTAAEGPVSEMAQELDNVETFADQVTLTDSSKALAEDEVPDSIRQMFADAENALQNETSRLFEINVLPEVEQQPLESTNNTVEGVEQGEVAASDNAVDEVTSPICEWQKAEQLCDDEPSTSSAIGSVAMATGSFQIAEPSLTGEEPTLECLRGAFLAAESKLEAESKVSTSLVADESHDAIEEEEHIDSVTSDSKSGSSSVVNDTFETANFSLGDIEKAVIDHVFFDAEDNMKDVDGNSIQNVQNSSECNLYTEDCIEDRSEEVSMAVPDTEENGIIVSEEEDGKLSASFEKTLACDIVEPTEANVTEKDFVKPGGDGNYVGKLDESTDNAAAPLVNDSADETQVNDNTEKNTFVDPQSAKMSSSNALDESVVDESMFMPNASMEVASPPLILEQILPSGVAESHRTTPDATPEEEYESEDGDDDEDFFPNRDLRSSNVPKGSAASTTSSVAENSSQPGSISSRKHDVKDLITGSKKASSSRLSNVPNRKQTGSSSASSKHLNRLSTSATALKPALSSHINPASTSSKGEKSPRVKDSSSKPQHTRVRIRAKKSAIPIHGKENNEAEHTSKDDSLGASKKSYSVERLERLAKPRRESMAPEPSPVKQPSEEERTSKGCRWNAIFCPTIEADVIIET